MSYCLPSDKVVVSLLLLVIIIWNILTDNILNKLIYIKLIFCIKNISQRVYNKYFKSAKYKVIKGENQALLSVSDALILASGTVALEAALYNTPMIISYRGPLFFYIIYLLVRCIKKVSLPNIIANKDMKAIMQYNQEIINENVSF